MSQPLCKQCERRQPCARGFLCYQCEMENRTAVFARSMPLNDDWVREQQKHEVTRLESILRNPQASGEETRIAADQLRHWRAVQN